MYRDTQCTWFDALLSCSSTLHAVFNTVVQFPTLNTHTQKRKRKRKWDLVIPTILKQYKKNMYKLSVCVLQYAFTLMSISPSWCRTCWAVSLGRFSSTDTTLWSWDSTSYLWASHTTSAHRQCQCYCARRCSRHTPKHTQGRGKMYWMHRQVH